MRRHMGRGIWKEAWHTDQGASINTARTLQAKACLRKVYMYIYILDSHMAPYGACEVAQSTARSKAQFEAERFRKENRRKKKHCRKRLRRKKKHCRKCFRRKKKHARKCFRRKNKHARAVIASVSAFKACSSSDFERAVASISIARWPRRKKKHARALISSAQWLQSTFEQ